MHRNIIYISTILGLFIIVACSRTFLNKDDAIAFFKSNQADFKTLRLMFLEDRNLKSIGRYNTGELFLKLYNENGEKINPGRQEKYVKIFDKLNLKAFNVSTLEVNEKKVKSKISFIVFRSGGALGGSMGSYIWSDTILRKEYFYKNDCEVDHFIQMDNNWYLLIEFCS